MLNRLLIPSAWLLGFWSSSVVALAGEDAGSGRETPAARIVVAAESVSTPTGGSRDAATELERPRVSPRNPRVVFITAKDCEECDRVLTRLHRPGGDFETMKSLGWKIGEGPENHIQLVDRAAVADLVEKLGVRDFPTVACITDGEIVRAFQSGCTTPLDSWTLSWLMKGKDERPTPVKPEPITVATTGNYPLRGNHWSMDGIWNPSKEALVSHLRGPVHGPQLAASYQSYQIETWSVEELRSLHDNLHEREMGGAVPAGYATQQPAKAGFSSSSATNKFNGKF
ncbi:MAG: hypothetical protein H7062_06035 [Candidatus Saccharimonas sp.]|nr:hypothetical protein [Planctomycetaceae bacterium]